MRDYAKREDLAESTLKLEKAQAEIRYVVKKAVVNSTPWEIVNGIIGDIVKRYTVDIQDEEFKEKVKTSLFSFSTVAYRKAVEATSGINFTLLGIVKVITSEETTRERREKAIQTLLKRGEYIETAQPLQEFSEDYMKRVKTAWKELAESEAKDSYSDRVSLRNISEMQVRYERKQEELKTLIEKGNDLVWISAHANCSKRCAPWQGKLYSLMGNSGSIDGISYQPLAKATDNYYTTKSGKVYKNGCITGFNCRHFLTPYKKGNEPIQVSAETIKRAREINDKQRAYERQIRDNKALSIGYKDINSREARAYQLRAQELYKEYQEYSRKNNVAFYPARCQVFDGEELVSKRYKRLLGVE